MTDQLLQQIAPITVALTAFITLIGGGCVNVLLRIRKMAVDIDVCKERDLENKGKLQTMGMCLRLLIPEIERIDPRNHVVNQVRALLDQSFPIDPDMPDDMLEMLTRIDRKRRLKT